MEYDRDLAFVYRNPTKIVFGEKTANDVGIEIGELGCGRAFVITDPGVVAAGIAERIYKALGGRHVGTYDRCIQDSGIHVINEATEAARDAGADCLVSVGGGSTIDTAKGISILLKEGGKLEDYSGFQMLRRPQTPHVVVPTTAGTGSEATMTAVVKDWDKHQKLLFSDNHIIPNVGILDPTIVEGLPAGLTATTGMDAFTHAVEAIHTIQASPVSDAMALEAIRLITQYLPRCVADGSDLVARGQQQCAATMAGVAFDNAQVGLPHAMAHSIGGLFSVPHGMANSIVLPHAMRFNLEACPDRYKLVARAMGLDVARMSDMEAAEAAIDAISSMTEKLGIARRLRDAGVPEDGLEQAAELCMSDGCIVYNPTPIFEPEQVLKVFVQAW
ncbi:MAG: iron-containing alcohol dehydrogenase [Candidatus Geothermincolia bacterium]